MKAFLSLVFMFSLLAGSCFCQPAPNQASLCLLQQSVRQGEHQRVRTSGIVYGGLNEVFEDPACPEESTWLEADLRSQRNKKNLDALLDRSNQAYVVIEGEFYGPPNPDPTLPEKIRENYHPNWGHLNCCRTKLVVHKLIEVKPAPRDSEQ